MIIRRNISDLYAVQPFFDRSNLPEKMKNGQIFSEAFLFLENFHAFGSENLCFYGKKTP